MANLTTEMKQLIGLLETAVHNANDSQNRVGTAEAELSSLSDMALDNDADLFYQLALLRLGIDEEDLGFTEDETSEYISTESEE